MFKFKHLNTYTGEGFKLFTAITLILWYSYIFDIFDRFDWNNGFIRFASFFALTLTVLFISKNSKHSSAKPLTNFLLSFFLVVIIFFTLQSVSEKFFAQIQNRSLVDLGYATEDATIMLFRSGENPYQSKTLAVLGHNTDYYGYKYGPFMLAGYAFNALVPQTGLKLTSLFYLVAIAATSIAIINNKKNTFSEQITTTLFVIALLVLPRRLWFELIVQGANDLFPMLLILLSILFIKKRTWLLAGLSAGLAFSSKIFPPALFLLLLFRKKTNYKVYVGAALGLLPFLPFLAADWQALINNVFIFHAVKGFDSTSLFSVTPPELHYIYPTMQIITVLAILIFNFNKKIEYQSLILQFAVTYAIIEVGYKEIHQNHLLFYIPVIAIIFTQFRYLPSSLLRKGIDRPD